MSCQFSWPIFTQLRMNALCHGRAPTAL
jgi:hypothetical protein